MSECADLAELDQPVARSAEEHRALVFKAEEIMRRSPLIDLPVRHHFSQGVYGREMFIPKGTTVSGHIHKYPQLNVLLCGDLTVSTEDGPKRVRPPFVVVSPPGTKRIAYAHEDSIWLTVHGTELNDVAEIEQHFIAKNEKEYQEFAQAQVEDKSCLGLR